jgi:HSP20 family protein
MLMRLETLRGYGGYGWVTDDSLSQRRARQIPVDAYRSGDEFKIHFDMPGVDAGSIELTVEKDVLSVKAMRTWTPVEGDQMQMTERAQGTFSRQLFLGESLDSEHITAIYENGVLDVTIPVAEEAKPRQVEIVHASGVQPVLTAATATA